MSTNQTPDSGAEQGHDARAEEAGRLEALRISEIRYRRLFEAAQDGILILDAETGMVTDVNPYLLDLLDYSEAEVLRKKIWELGFLADVVANEDRFQELRREKYVRYENLALEGRNGKRHEVEFISNVYQEGSHKVIQCNVRDISARKRHEADAHNLLQVLRAVRNVNQLITHEKDRDALIQRACHILSETRGYRSAWIALLDGTDHLLVITEAGTGAVLEAFRSPLEPEHWPECCRRALEGDGIIVMRDTQQNCSTCPLPRDHRDTAALATGLRHGGQDYGVLVVTLPQDLADDPQEQSLFRELAGDIGYALHNIRAEDVLWHSRAILRAVLDNIPARVFWKDLDLDYLGCNQAFARDAGCEKPDDLVGKDDFAMGWRADAERYRRDDREVMETGESKLLIEEPQTTPSGETIHLLTSKVPLRDAQGAVIGVLGTYMDVSEMKRAEAEREKLQTQFLHAQRMEAVGRLAGGVAHDFNNLLMGIMNYAELCRDKVAADHPIREWLDEITAEGNRSANLVRQLLAFARKQATQPQPLDLNEQIEAILKMLRRLIGERIELTWSPVANLPDICADPAHIDQVLANLCVNAADAIAGNGHISIATCNAVFDSTPGAEMPGMVPGSYVLVTVTDTGCGMDAETQAHAFEPFFTTKEEGRGTGLGLATVYGIVKQSGGFIYIDSAPGEGTTFRIYLPALEGAKAEAATAVAAAAPPRGTETILIVDDDRSIRLTVAANLDRLGYSVLTADAPDTALRLASEHAGEIDLLLSDVVMPGMSGAELRKRLLASRPGIKTILMSGYAAAGFAASSSDETSTVRLTKPVPTHELAVAVRAVLDNKHPDGNGRANTH